MERAVLVVRRAEIAQAGVRLAREPLLERAVMPRLADARLAREQHDLTLAAPGSLPAPEQQLDLLLAPDQRRLRRPSAAPRTGSRRRSRRTTRQACTGSAKPFTSTAAEIRVLEETAGQPARGLRRSRPRSGSARACSRAARFGVSPTTACSCAAPDADQIADHDQPGGDADPDLQRLARGTARCPTASTSASPARTARSASSSCACG